jgi:hypothetical protein
MSSDDPTRHVLEEFARAVDRRSFLRRVSSWGFAAAVATAWGSLGAASRVMADSTCSCSFPNNGVWCNSVGYTCPYAGGCPSGCETCDNCECSDCCYTTGWWYSCGCGSHGMGCHKCYDCKCPTGSSCARRCGCRSGQCYCCSCLTPQDIANELAGVQQLGAH